MSLASVVHFFWFLPGLEQLPEQPLVCWVFVQVVSSSSIDSPTSQRPMAKNHLVPLRWRHDQPEWLPKEVCLPIAFEVVKKRVWHLALLGYAKKNAEPQIATLEMKFSFVVTTYSETEWSANSQDQFLSWFWETWLFKKLAVSNCPGKDGNVSPCKCSKMRNPEILHAKSPAGWKDFHQANLAGQTVKREEIPCRCSDNILDIDIETFNMFSCKSVRTNIKEYCLQSRNTCFCFTVFFGTKQRIL